MKATIYKNMLEVSTPFYRPVTDLLDRIKSGKSKGLVEAIRDTREKEERDRYKKMLPAVSWSGEFTKRSNSAMTKYNRLICLDFDNVIDVPALKAELSSLTHCYACWVSPSGTGVKMLVRVNSDDHRAHFLALQQDHPNVDQSGKDVSRLCFESYDPDLYLNEKAVTYKKLIKKEVKNEVVQKEGQEAYEVVKKWLLKQGINFSEGSRNMFITHLASACLRVGIDKETARMFMYADFVNGSGFDLTEFDRTVDGIYARYSADFGKGKIQDEKVTIENRELTKEDLDPDEEVADLVTCADVWDKIESNYVNGLQLADTTYFEDIDQHWKWLRGQLTVLNGYGNYGKSTFMLHLMMVRSVKVGNKWCIFSPEHESDFFYQELIQQYVGKSMMQTARNRMSMEELKRGRDFVNEHFYLIDPKKMPTPDYVLERFFETAVKFNVDGVMIDPFNQLEHSWDMKGGRDLYLEAALPKFKRFARENQLYTTIVAHPKNPDTGEKNSKPTVFQLSGGSMWNNKADNILCYHRPNHHVDKSDPTCVFSSDKVRNQQVVGIPGEVEMIYDRVRFRFYVNEKNPLEEQPKQSVINAFNDEPDF